MAYATPDDVETAVGRPLTDTEGDQVTGWLDDAGLVIDGEGYTFTTDDPPDAFKRVSINMAVRALRAAGIIPGAQSQQTQDGPFARQVTYTATASSGGVWLSAMDRLMLKPYRGSGGMMSLQLASERVYTLDES